MASGVDIIDGVSSGVLTVSFGEGICVFSIGVGGVIGSFGGGESGNSSYKIDIPNNKSRVIVATKSTSRQTYQLYHHQHTHNHPCEKRMVLIRELVVIKVSLVYSVRVG